MVRGEVGDTAEQPIRLAEEVMSARRNVGNATIRAEPGVAPCRGSDFARLVRDIDLDGGRLRRTSRRTIRPNKIY